MLFVLIIYTLTNRKNACGQLCSSYYKKKSTQGRFSRKVREKFTKGKSIVQKFQIKRVNEIAHLISCVGFVSSIFFHTNRLSLRYASGWEQFFAYKIIPEKMAITKWIDEKN